MSFFKKLFGLKDDDKPAEDVPAKNGLDPYKAISWMTDRRLQNVATCLEAGYRPTTSLPMDLGRELRPSLEIAKRLNAIKALVLWVAIPPENLPDENIRAFVDKNDLKAFMTEEETAIFSLARNDEEGLDAIGWKFENSWPLAWYFGYNEPEITGEMMSGEQMQTILQEYTCPLKESVADWANSQTTISAEVLAQKEDLFYCLHNAVRSAQLGGQTVPENFHPLSNGGVIHERRHSLTWMLSKGVSWEETDLST